MGRLRLAGCSSHGRPDTLPDREGRTISASTIAGIRWSGRWCRDGGGLPFLCFRRSLADIGLLLRGNDRGEHPKPPAIPPAVVAAVICNHEPDQPSLVGVLLRVRAALQLPIVPDCDSDDVIHVGTEFHGRTAPLDTLGTSCRILC